MNETYLLLTLACFFATMFLVTNLFWFYQYNKLLNKFMSRNYSEYLQSELSIVGDQGKSEVKVDVKDHPYDEQRAKELNQMMGML